MTPENNLEILWYLELIIEQIWRATRLYFVSKLEFCCLYHLTNHQSTAERNTKMKKGNFQQKFILQSEMITKLLSCNRS